MARYALLRIEDDGEADDLLRSVALFPRDPLLTSTGQGVFVELVPDLDAGDRLSRGDAPGLAAVVRESYLRASELAAEWEASA